MMFKKVLKFCFGAVLNFSAVFSQTREVRYVPTEMVNRQQEYNRRCYKYACMPEWINAGITGEYSIAGTQLVRRAFGSCFNEADSFLGFCRAVQLYKTPSPRVLETLLDNCPQQPWLEKIYQNHVTAYQRLAVRDCEKLAAELLAYSTCAKVPGEVLKSHLGKVREAINGGTWTLADAYVFLGVYPSKHYFGWGDLSKEDEEVYALCIADSLKAILIAEKEEKWDEIVRQAKEAEAAEREFEERFSSWGSEDVQRKELQCQQTGSEKRSDDQSELDRLYKLDVARAYLFLAVKCP